MTILAAIALVAVATDPRPALLETQRSGDLRAAVVETERIAAAEPERARELGLGLLRGHLLARMGRLPEAASAYASALGETPDLEPWTRMRLAETQERLGHPEVAAGIAAHLLSRETPPSLLDAAVRLLVRTLRRGGDCRLLGALPPISLHGRSSPTERLLALAAAECALRTGDEAAARQLLATILSGNGSDLAAFDAAELWLESWPPPDDVDLLRSLGGALAEQRDFERAVPILERALAGGERTGSAVESATLYQLARAEFWLGHHARAGRVFEEIFRTSRSPALRVDARYQQARCLELTGAPAAAAELFAEVHELEPHGEWAGAALLSGIRLDWLAGRLLEASATLDRLAADRRQQSPLARAAIFLVASEIVAGRAAPEVAHWLDLAERSTASSREEVGYWRGRLAELEGRPADAVSSYLAAARVRPFHPLAVAARTRLDSASLAPEARRRAAQLARGPGLDDLRAAWTLAGPTLPVALQARARALAALSRDPAVALWIRWAETPIAEWPLFADEIRRPEDRLLALGLWFDGRAALGSRFPLRQRRLAFTASATLDDFDQSHLGIGLAERLFDGKPRALPIDWVDPELRRRLYPFPYRRSIVAQASLRRIDPWLLVAILREESRFDPQAV
ncbi:MAG: hypothetical protein R2862_07515 [Thermoanaerobaculia bacterium]